jgi:hypothetical protein
MKYFIIATTAINRPMLHNDNMGEWVDWLLNANMNKRDTTFKWFLNIDIVEKLKSSYEDTKSNFEKIIDNRIDTTYLSNPNGKGNFLEACKRLSLNIVKYVDNLNISQKEQKKIKIIWLEDDWKLSNITKIPFSEVVQNYTTDNAHTNLSFNRNNYIWALAPSIISYGLWKNLFYTAWTSETNQIDPEHCVGLYYRKVYGNPDLLCNVTIINKSVKDKYLAERHMTFPESYYTYHNDKYQVNNNDRYVFKDCLTSYLGDKMTFIRITPSFCIDGCTYGRKFLEKYNIGKSHSADVNEFYADTVQSVSSEKKESEIPEQVSDTPKKDNTKDILEPVQDQNNTIELVTENVQVLESTEKTIDPLVEVKVQPLEDLNKDVLVEVTVECLEQSNTESVEEVQVEQSNVETAEELASEEMNKILLSIITAEPLVILEEMQ